MLKHVHDLKNDLRERGWWERETPEVSQTSFLRSHSSVTTTSSYIGVTDNSAQDLERTYSFEGILRSLYEKIREKTLINLI